MICLTIGRCDGAGVSITWEAFVGVTAQLKSQSQISHFTLIIIWVSFTRPVLEISSGTEPLRGIFPNQTFISFLDPSSEFLPRFACCPASNRPTRSLVPRALLWLSPQVIAVLGNQLISPVAYHNMLTAPTVNPETAFSILIVNLNFLIYPIID